MGAKASTSRFSSSSSDTDAERQTFQDATSFAPGSPDSPSSNLTISSGEYGGSFPWVDVHYKMHIKMGISPLQWMNAFTKRLLLLEDIALAADGTFRRPDGTLIFPKRNIDLRWRYDECNQRIIINFFDKDKLLEWRWDEMKPKSDLSFPSTAPDFVCIGHVGKFTFDWSLTSAAALEGESPSIQKNSPSASFDADPRLLAKLQPVSREGDLFNWWNSRLADERSRVGYDGMGAVFAMPPDEAMLGEGAYGFVWLARNSETGERYAMKNVLVRNNANNRSAMAKNEIYIVEKIITRPHPCIVEFFALEVFTIPRGELYILAMEFCSEGDLQQRMDKCVDGQGAYTPPSEALLWFGQIFLAVEHIHTKLSLLIRDLKPSNVVLDTCHNAKLTDFGFGRMVDSCPGGTWTFYVPPCSPGYAAPELLSQEPYSYPVDIYSLGVVLWVLLSGGVPEMKIPSPPSNGSAGAFSTYIKDWKLLKAALKEGGSSMGRCAVEDDAVDMISAMTKKKPSDRLDVDSIRNTSSFFLNKVLPALEKNNQPSSKTCRKTLDEQFSEVQMGA